MTKIVPWPDTEIDGPGSMARPVLPAQILEQAVLKLSSSRAGSVALVVSPSGCWDHSGGEGLQSTDSRSAAMSARQSHGPPSP